MREQLDGARAEIARLKSAPGEVWERMGRAVHLACETLEGRRGHHADTATMLRVTWETLAAVEQTVPRPALTEEEARDVDSHLAALRPAPEGGRGSDTTSRP